MWNYVAEYKGIRCNLVKQNNNTILTTNDASALTLGFEKDVRYNGDVYYWLTITSDLLENAYKSECYGEYNGDVLECDYSKERRTFSVHLGENEELCRRYGIGDVYDRYIGSRGYECFNDLWIVVPEDEVLDFWEQRSPIKGFPFHGPERVDLRKDGVWLR